MKDMCAQIAKTIESYIEGVDLDENCYEVNLAEVGMTSISFIQIIVEIEDRFQIEIPDEYLLFSNMDTVHKMASIVMSLKGNLER